MRTLSDVIDRISSRVFARDDRGQDLLEYGLLMALIAIVALTGVSAVGRTIYTVFWKTIANSV